MTEITNPWATQNDSVYSICDLSGQKAKRNELVPMYPDLMVLPEHWNARNEQDVIRYKSEQMTSGAKRPEPMDPIFIETAVIAEDL